jgi:hypothetical protein
MEDNWWKSYVSTPQINAPKERNTYFNQGTLDIYIAVSNIQGKNFACVHDKRDDTGGDQNRNEQRGDWIKSCPSVKLDEQS